MALTDINFQEGDRMDFINEIPVGTLYAPVDILVENDNTGIYFLKPQQLMVEGEYFHHV